MFQPITFGNLARNETRNINCEQPHGFCICEELLSTLSSAYR